MSLGGLSAQLDDFVTTWTTTNEGASDDQSITIPTHFAQDYNYHVDWNNDGIYDEIGVTGDVTHDFGAPGTYTIRIGGDFPTIYFDGAYIGHSGDEKKLVSIDQWGSNVWTTFESAFKGCENMNITATDAPDLSMVFDMSYMFENCTSLDCNLNAWDVSTVYDMTGMFQEASAFNSDLDQWDVSGVHHMAYMFASADAFNGDISTWDVSSLQDAEGMFMVAASFNNDISAWNTASLTDVRFMFQGAEMFEQNIGDWDVSNVQDFTAMFSGAVEFDSPLYYWDMSSAQVLTSMFSGASNFNRNITGWDVSNVTHMDNMFTAATAFNQDISSWDVSSVVTFNGTFMSAELFDQNLGAWDVVSATDMEDMFHLAGVGTWAYDHILMEWSGKALQSGVTFNAGNSIYCVGEDARQNIIDMHGWTITDGGPDPDVDCVTSVDELMTIDARIFPSPAIDHINIQIDEAITGPMTVRLIDAIGKEILTSTVNGPQTRMDLVRVPEGFYSLVISGEDQVYHQQVFIGQ
ncbi:MAG: BspA family leucine-rich repeat surface protein [Flavobacteriales bacterium]|nr:BspA family leucine-rich repeat surface protein [Flavobacteriales bacterium]